MTDKPDRHVALMAAIEHHRGNRNITTPDLLHTADIISQWLTTHTQTQPGWVTQLNRTIQQVLTNQEKNMALTDDLKSAITALTDQVNALVAEDGVVVQALKDLLAKAQAQGGSVSDTDVQAALTTVQQVTATIQAQVAQVDAEVKADDPTPAPGN